MPCDLQRAFTLFGKRGVGAYRQQPGPCGGSKTSSARRGMVPTAPLVRSAGSGWSLT